MSYRGIGRFLQDTPRLTRKFTFLFLSSSTYIVVLHILLLFHSPPKICTCPLASTSSLYFSPLLLSFSPSFSLSLTLFSNDFTFLLFALSPSHPPPFVKVLWYSGYGSYGLRFQSGHGCKVFDKTLIYVYHSPSR